MTVIIDFPWYFVILCLLLGVAYALLLYWLGLRRKKEDPPFSRGLTIGLSALRCIAVAAIAFLFLAPLVKRQQNRKEKPIVVVAQDNSKSLDYCADSAFYHDQFAADLDALCERLGKDFDVVRYSYGGKVRKLPADDLVPYGDQLTDMGAVVDEVRQHYYHRNVGALVLTGDGIFNQGRNPVGMASELTFPVYTVAMGDTTVRHDAAIADIRFNRIAYLGNNFPIDITVNAAKLKGQHSTLSVSLDGRKLFSKQITFADDLFSTTENVVLEAQKTGVLNFVVEIAPLPSEQNVRNNRRIIPIEVIDGHQKIAIIAAAPHPDVAALRAAIERNQNFEADFFLAKDFSKNPKDYDLLILHQLPSKTAEAGLDVAALLKSEVSTLFILGAQTDLARLNALHAGLEVYSRIDRQNEASALFNKDFTFFTIDDDKVQSVSSFPPLLSPFGEYKLDGNGQTLFWAKVGAVNSRMPLVAVTQQQGRRAAFIAGEGLWRWRLADWQNNQSHDNFDQLIDKLVVFTALRVNKEKFRVDMKHLFGQSEAVTIEAQLYNDNYEPVNTPDAELTLKSADGNTTEKKFFFNRTAGGYALNLGQLPSGNYKYTASTRFNGHTLTSTGSFVVEEQQMEALNLVANHSLLYTMATTTGGQMVDAHNVAQIEELLKQRDDMKTLIYSETRYSDMLNLPLIFILIILLLGVEWFLRKYNGEI